VIDPTERHLRPADAPLRNRIADGIAIRVTAADIATDPDGRPASASCPTAGRPAAPSALGDQRRSYQVEVNWLTGESASVRPGDGP